MRKWIGLFGWLCVGLIVAAIVWVCLHLNVHFVNPFGGH